MSDCPPSLRGDLTKWLFEINTGVYVGNLPARVREELWKRICDHLGSGYATMVYNASNEQGMQFRTWNSEWDPVDFDGVTLMRHPLPDSGRKSKEYKSNAEIFRMARRKTKSKRASGALPDFSVVDLETSGLDPEKDRIIELGAVRIRDHKIDKTFSRLIYSDQKLSEKIHSLTGIESSELETAGVDLRDAISDLLKFVGTDTLLFYHSSFDLAFLLHACQSCGRAALNNRSIDVMRIVKKQIPFLDNYKLATISAHLGLQEQTHRALDDCILTYQVYAKLNEMGA